MKRLAALVCAGFALTTLETACSSSAPADESIADEGSRIIYGEDDRQEPFSYPDPAWAARALEFSVALMSPGSIDESDPNNVRIAGPTWIERDNVCSDERFATQPAFADCSGTLIDEDLVLTSAHCINTCPGGARFVFDYAMAPGGGLQRITSDDVYDCVDIVASQLDWRGADYAVVRLNRPVVGREPARVRLSTEALPVGTPLITHGFPRGLPLKLADGAAVRSNAPGLPFFVANLDTFVGNSGGGVFDLNSRELVGILVRGGADFVEDGTCQRPNRCADDACRGEDVTYAFQAVRPLCERTVSGVCSCGDSACGPLENAASCASDCSCGDGVCSAGETASCPADCRLQVSSATHTQQPNWVTPAFQLRNAGNDAENLWGNVVRYYFTQEPPGSLTAECWGCSTAFDFSFHSMPGGGCAGATHYLDVRFRESIFLDPGASSDPFRLAFRASSWRAFDQTNDYSYSPRSSFTLNPRMTAYSYVGVRIAGEEPCPGIFAPPTIF